MCSRRSASSASWCASCASRSRSQRRWPSRSVGVASACTARRCACGPNATRWCEGTLPGPGTTLGSGMGVGAPPSGSQTIAEPLSGTCVATTASAGSRRRSSSKAPSPHIVWWNGFASAQNASLGTLSTTVKPRWAASSTSSSTSGGHAARCSTVSKQVIAPSRASPSASRTLSRPSSADRSACTRSTSRARRSRPASSSASASRSTSTTRPSSVSRRASAAATPVPLPRSHHTPAPASRGAAAR